MSTTASSLMHSALRWRCYWPPIHRTRMALPGQKFSYSDVASGLRLDQPVTKGKTRETAPYGLTSADGRLKFGDQHKRHEEWKREHARKQSQELFRRTHLTLNQDPNSPYRAVAESGVMQKRNGSQPAEKHYVLTLMTNEEQHKHMTALRDKYFPKELNKLEAHLTLFHALPGSRLESDIIPALEDIASKTTQFQIQTDKTFRMKKGFAMGLARNRGFFKGINIRKELQNRWYKGNFLSRQDGQQGPLHYTLMNKVDDQDEIDRAMQEVDMKEKPNIGYAYALGLYLFDRGYWTFERQFDFVKPQ